MNKKKHTDAGLALVLILLLTGYFTSEALFFYWAIPVVLITMTVPVLLTPFTLFWLGFSSLLGSIMSSVILSLIFFILVVPIGVIRQLLGYDSMKLKAFKASNESVLIHRDHRFTASDLEQPF